MKLSTILRSLALMIGVFAASALLNSCKTHQPGQMHQHADGSMHHHNN
jgi:hypothetical protein